MKLWKRLRAGELLTTTDINTIANFIRIELGAIDYGLREWGLSIHFELAWCFLDLEI